MAGNELNWKTAFKKILLKDEPLQSEVEQNVNNQHVLEHDSRGDTEKLQKVPKQFQDNESLNSKFMSSQHMEKYDSKGDSEKLQKQVHEQFNYKSSTSNFRSSKGLRDEVPKWDNAFKDIFSEKKPTIQHESDSPCTSSINSESTDYAYLTSRLIRKVNDQPHQKQKPRKNLKKKELTPEEKKVEELFAMCINFKPVAKFKLNDFDGAGINVFKTVKSNSEGSTDTVNDTNEVSDALYDKSSKTNEHDSKTNVGVEWTKTTSYTFEDAKKAKDKIVLTEVWELDDNFISHSTKTNKNPSVRRHKRYYK